MHLRPLGSFADSVADRRFDVFGTSTVGNVNIVRFHADQSVPWQRHALQGDQIVVTAGTMYIGVADEAGGEERWVALTWRSSHAVDIPPGRWHAFRAGPEGCTFVYYMSVPYDPEAPDVEYAVGDEGLGAVDAGVGLQAQAIDPPGP